VKAFYAQYLTRRGGPDVDNTFAHFGAELYGYMWGPSEFTATGTLREYDVTGRLGEVRVPTLFVAGEHDEASPPTARYYQSLIPGAEVAIIPGAAHLTMQDAPDREVEAVREFLARVDIGP
jgi:proline iminopeptidase